eukprot:scaffold69336_cov12-Tisochrysis_lutea.AAC.1
MKALAHLLFKQQRRLTKSSRKPLPPPLLASHTDQKTWLKHSRTLALLIEGQIKTNKFECMTNISWDSKH